MECSCEHTSNNAVSFKIYENSIKVFDELFCTECFFIYTWGNILAMKKENPQKYERLYRLAKDFSKFADKKTKEKNNVQEKTKTRR